MEVTLPGQAQSNIINFTIADPVDNVRYQLDSRRRVAHKILMPPRPVATAAAGTVRSAVARPISAPVAISPAGIATMGNAQVATGALMSPFPATSPGAKPEIKTENLGQKSIEGLLAEGMRTTVVYPINAFGNDREITAVTETWHSAELGLAVLTTTSDPRQGVSTMRITNVSRAEPDPALFQVPANYTVEEQPAPQPRPTAPAK
jgi:hypothetical protein